MRGGREDSGSLQCGVFFFFLTTHKHKTYCAIKKERKLSPWLVCLSGSSIHPPENLKVGFPVRAQAWVVGQVPAWEAC